MGIEGLGSFISTNSEIFLETVNLSHQSVVIEAECILYEMYGRNIDKVYINRYEEFKRKVCRFLDDFLDCHITPIIVFRGGKEVQNLTKDSKELEKSISKVELGLEKRKMTQPPILLEEIIKFAANRKSVKYVQTLFKAEYDIVSIAKILDCPIISNNNHYYLHNVTFIPFSELKKVKVEKSFALKCKLFRTESILKYFPDHRAMAVAKIVMSNFSRKFKIFDNFYSLLSLNNEIKSRSERRVQAVLSWFQAHYSVENVVSEILKTVDKEHHTEVLKIFENSIYEHINISPRLLKSVGIPEKVIDEIILDSESFQLQNKCDTSSNFNFFSKNSKNSLMFKNKRFEIVPILNQTALPWFIDDFNDGKYPSYFIDIQFRKLYIPPVQMENLCQESSVNISLRIIGVIYKILVEDSVFENLKYVTRGKNETDIEIFELSLRERNYNFEIPYLESLRDTTLEKKKEIFSKTLEISERHLDSCPQNWTLFMAAIVYWYKNAQTIFTEECHLYALLLTLINSVVDKQIYRKSFLSHKYFDKVTKDDCFAVKQTIKSSLKARTYFDINKTHAFSLFENSLYHIIHLNALLDYPYREIDIAALFNGKVVDQFYHNLKGKRNPLDDIKTIFENSPSFIKLFESVLAKFHVMVQDM